MICPECKATAKCRDSRQDGEARRRRYNCACGVRFTTAEVVLHVGTDKRGVGGGRRGKRPTLVQNFIKRQKAAEAAWQAIEKARAALDVTR